MLRWLQILTYSIALSAPIMLVMLHYLKEVTHCSAGLVCNRGGPWEVLWPPTGRGIED